MPREQRKAIRHLGKNARKKKRKYCFETGKVSYTRKKVKTVAAGMQRRKRGPTRWYRCPFCDQWHLTSQVQDGES